MAAHPPQLESNNEIDLVRLFSRLWGERKTIIICTTIITILGLVYSYTIKPIYQASLQIEHPTISQISPLNNTQIISATPESTFSLLLNILESANYKRALINTEKTLLAKFFNTSVENISIENIDINTLYTINYPNLRSQKNNLKPKHYTINSQGTNRQLTSQLLKNTIKLANIHLLRQWEKEFDSLKKVRIQKITQDSRFLSQSIKERRENTIIQLQEKTNLQIKNTQDELTARKNYVLTSRKNKIILTKEALSIAKTLKITQPSTLNRMSIATNLTSKQIAVNTEINNQQEPLYLRGSNLLAIELESLLKLPNSTLLDTKVIDLENKLLILKNNREIETLNARTNDVAFNATMQSYQEELRILTETNFPTLTLNFLNNFVYSPTKSIEPKKTTILTISIFLGVIFSLLVALGKIIYKNYPFQKIFAN